MPNPDLKGEKITNVFDLSKLLELLNKCLSVRIIIMKETLFFDTFKFPSRVHFSSF